MDCPALDAQRRSLWTELQQHLPLGMISSMLAMGPGEITEFMLGGLRADYTPEWQTVYEAVANFVNSMLEERKKLYNIDIVK